MDLWLKTGSFVQQSNNNNNSAGKDQRANSNNAPGLKHAKACEAAMEVVSPDEYDLDDPDQSNLDISFSSIRSQQEDRDSAVTEARKKRRRYDNDYIRFGFFWTGSAEAPLALCLLCHRTLCNEALKPSKLRKHLEIKHKESTGKPIEFFQEKCEKFKSRLKEDAPQLSKLIVKERITLDSLRASLLIAKSDIVTDLVKPAAKKITKIVFGEKVKYEIEKVTLSKHSVKQRIALMDENVKNQLVARLQQSKYFSLQVDESTTSGNKTYLQCYIRYIYSGDVHDEFLFCRPLSNNATGENMFNVLDDFIVYNNLDWSQCVGISIDVAFAAAGRWKCLVRLVQEVAPLTVVTYYSIHHEQLIKRNMPSCLMAVLDEAVRIVNFIRGRDPDSFMFKALCEEMGDEHVKLLCHSEVCWLSQGNVLMCLLELRNEMKTYLHECDDLKNRIYEFQWLSKLAYLADTFSTLNRVKHTLLGKGITIFHIQDRIQRTRIKLSLWCECLDHKDFRSFPTCADYLVTVKEEIDDDTIKAFKGHLQSLHSELGRYFPEPDPSFEWIRNPFVDKIHIKKACNKLSSKAYDNLVEMSTDRKLKKLFEMENLNSFWVKVEFKYPELADMALRHLLPFPAAYNCETGLSTLLYLKSEMSDHIDIEPIMRLRLSSIHPEISKLARQ